MKITARRIAAAAAAGGLALAGLAIGGAALAGVGAHTQTAVPKVTVGLKEFRLIPSTKRLQTGRVTFVAVNRGSFPHALEIKGPGVKAKTAILQPGKSARLTVTLKKGSYSFWCPVRNHAALGMKMTLRVGASASTGGGAPVTPAPTTTSTPTTTPTTSSGGGGYGY